MLREALLVVAVTTALVVAVSGSGFLQLAYVGLVIVIAALALFPTRPQ